MIFFCIKNIPNRCAAGMRQQSLQILKLPEPLAREASTVFIGRSRIGGRHLASEREGSDDAELVGAFPSGSHKQHGSVVGRSRSPAFVAVADDAPGELSQVQQ